MNTNSFLMKINVCLTYFITIWICCPLVSQRTGMICGAILSILWVITAIALNKGFKINKIFLYVLIFILFLFISFAFNKRIYALMEPVAALAYICLFFLNYFIFSFYADKNINILKKIFYISLFSLSIGCVISIYYSNLMPGIMKYIDMTTYTEADPYRKSGIGAFGFVYLLVIAILVCFNSIISFKNCKNKFILILFIILGSYTVVVSTYTTALLLLLFGFLFIIIFRKVKKISLNFILSILLILLSLIMLKNFIGNLLINLKFENEGMTIRFNEIGEFLLGNEEGYNLSMRIKYFKQSFDCFIQNFLFGYNFNSNLLAINPGGHSQLIDTFAVYGVICGIVVYLLIISMLKKVFIFERRYESNFGIIILLILIIYSFIEPLIYIYQVGFAIFMMSACSIVALKGDKKYVFENSSN